MNHSVNNATRLLLGAIAAVSVLAGCQQKPLDVNPDFDPEKDAVNAQFVMSVATGTGRATKMSADAAQKNTNFYGINNAKLILYAHGGTDAFVSSTDGTNVKRLFELGPVWTQGSINPSANTSSSSNRVLQLTIPLGADAALFYGKANNDNPGKARGKMNFSNIDEDPAKTWFGVETIIGSDENVAKYDATGRLMIYAINTILATSITATTTGPGSYSVNGYSNQADLPPLSWHELGHQWEVNNTNNGGNPYGRTGNVTPQVFLAESMGQAYATFTHIKAGEYRAGSSAAVKAMMQDLYSVVKNSLTATSLNDEELNVQRLAAAIKTNFQKFYNMDDWTYKQISDIQPSVPEETWNDPTTGFTGADDLNSYPYGTYGIPEGAAQLEFNKNTDKFSYIHPNNALVTPGNKFEPRKYVYPAELTYYVNSPLWITSKGNLSVGDFPNGTENWDKSNTEEGSKWKDGSWTQDRVQSSTRGVAIRDEIKYGTALLETSVAWSTEASTTGLLDNRLAMTGEENRTITIDQAHFELRGILIGGVHPRYDWQFLPRALTVEEAAQKLPDNTTSKFGVFDGVIYDDTITAGSIPTATPNYTLVFDSYDYGSSQHDVYVALEFVNNGEAFWGRDNLIPSGGVFYLGAKLTAAPKKLEQGHESEDQVINWPTNHEVPPIYESGENAGQSKQIPRVFIQGFSTKATFRIGRESLKYAYYTVPNLESSQMSFGLSVDLKWEDGYEYDMEFGENPGPAPANP